MQKRVPTAALSRSQKEEEPPARNTDGRLPCTSEYGFPGDINAFSVGRKTPRRLADAEIPDAAEILVVNAITAANELIRSRPDACTMALEDLRADGYRQVDIQLILEMFRFVSPPQRGNRPKKVYDEANLPASIASCRVSCEGPGLLTMPDQLMGNLISDQLLAAAAGAPPFVPYPSSDMDKAPWIPADPDRFRAHDSWYARSSCGPSRQGGLFSHGCFLFCFLSWSNSCVPIGLI